MMRKGVGFFILSLLIFIYAVTQVFNTPPQGVSSFSNTNMFDDLYEEKETKPIVINEDTELKLKIASYVKEGSLIFRLISPDNIVVYEKAGKKVYDLVTIPVTRGEWALKVESDHAKKGNFSLLAVVQYE